MRVFTIIVAVLWIAVLAVCLGACDDGGGDPERVPVAEKDDPDDLGAPIDDDAGDGNDDLGDVPRIPCNGVIDCPTIDLLEADCEFECVGNARNAFHECRAYTCLSASGFLYQARACCGGYCLLPQEILQKVGCE